MPVRALSRFAPILALAMTLSTSAGAQELSRGPTLSGTVSGIRDQTKLAPSDTIPRRRPRAVEYSDWYTRRATIHKVASWTTLPLFAAEVVTGQELFKNGPQAADWAKDSHGIIAGSLGGLFALNTVTGAWNLWDARKDPNGRKWRTVHAVLMLAADAGFAYTGSLADDAENSSVIRNRHRTAAITSSSIALASYLMMLPPLRRE